MPIQISSKVMRLKPSASIAAKQRVTDLEAKGWKIYDFCVGEPDFATPKTIVDAAIAAMRRGDTHYTGSSGILALREAVAQKLSHDNHVTYHPSEIVVANGAKQLIYELFAATLEPGNEVIVPAPYWVSYPDIVALNGGTPIVVSCGPEDNFKLTAASLESAITDKTRWVIINSPSNPTGAVYHQDEWQALIDVLVSHPHVSILTDEIYEHIIYENAQNITPVALDERLKERCVIVNGMSKAYAMTGWRLGFAAGPQHVMQAITKLLGQSTTCACSFAQSAAVEALYGSPEPVEEMLRAYTKRRSIMVDGLNRIEGICCTKPQGAFYAFPDVRAILGSKSPDGSTLTTDLDLVNYLIEEASVATMDGTSYGLPGFLRLSFATSQSMIAEGLEAMTLAIAKLDRPLAQA
ncbi:MAG: pyridoxal phosphate-dependent aminotransferase [Cohaesibacter sp.]|nr:pyridoxal phosphate-dependent aminotransferase [Cohaesibacter sp.]